MLYYLQKQFKKKKKTSVWQQMTFENTESLLYRLENYKITPLLDIIEIQIEALVLKLYNDWNFCNKTSSLGLKLPCNNIIKLFFYASQYFMYLHISFSQFPVRVHNWLDRGLHFTSSCMLVHSSLNMWHHWRTTSSLITFDQ